MKYPIATFAIVLLGACQSGGNSGQDNQTYTGIAPDEAIYFTGTEPFWGGEVANGKLIYTTPDNIDGVTIPVERFAGNAGIAFSGTLDGQPFDMTVTEGECSDGMSDRTYPFTVTLRIGTDDRYGCAYSDARGFTGPETP